MIHKRLGPSVARRVNQMKGSHIVTGKGKTGKNIDEESKRN